MPEPDPARIMTFASPKDLGPWENVYAASEMKVPADFLAALESKPKVKQFFETLTKSSHYEWPEKRHLWALFNH